MSPLSASSVFPLATRRSQLAQAQTRQVQALLKTQATGSDFPLETFVSTGDMRLEGSLAEVGGKGLFTKEIEQALLSGAARIAVHSMKDMPAEMPEGLVLGAIPKREDPRDAFIFAPKTSGAALSSLPQGAVIGTASVRRAAQMLRLRPDIKVTPFRGNIGRRLEKLNAGEVDGTFLAEAGLRRGGKTHIERVILDPKELLPALGQGALCIQVREDDMAARRLLRMIACPVTERCVAVERGFLARLDGSCRTPMAGLAMCKEETIWFRVEILSLDGKEIVEEDIRFSPIGVSHDEQLLDCTARGAALAEKMLDAAPKSIRDLLIKEA